jgi:tetratricopeptide (TPR) repeat protein
LNQLLQVTDLISQATVLISRAKAAQDDGHAVEASRALVNAEEVVRDALELSRKSKLISESTALGHLAAICLLQKKYSQTTSVLLDRLTLAEQRRDLRVKQATLEMLGRVAIEIEDWSGAERWYWDAIAIFEERREEIAAEALQTTFTTDAAALYDRLLQALTKSGNALRALEIIERAKSRALLSIMGTGELRRPSADSELLERESELIDEMREAIGALRARRKSDAIQRNKLWRTSMRLRSELDTLWEALARDPQCEEYVSLRRGTPPNAADVHALLGTAANRNTALLDYFVGKDASYVAVCTAHRAEPVVCEVPVPPEHLRLCARRLLIDCNLLKQNWREQEAIYSIETRSFPELKAAGIPVSVLNKMDRIRGERRAGWNNFIDMVASVIGESDAAKYKKVLLDKCVSDIREALKLTPRISFTGNRIQDSVGEGPARHLADPSYGYQMTYLEDLSTALLPSRVHDAIKGCEVLCISPHGPLHNIPFHALHGIDGRFLIESFGICYVPSAGVLKSCLNRNRARAGDHPTSCLFAGVDGKGSQASEFERDDDYLGRLFNKSKRSYLPLKGSAATPAHIMTELGRFDVVHITCHGMLAADRGIDDPLDSGLLLATKDGLPPKDSTSDEPFITAKMLFQMKMRANLTALRACSSGHTHIRAGDELMGLVRAFLYAGTSSLVVCLWNVNTNSARRLLAEFYRNWLESEGMPKWRALQKAQINMLRSRETDLRHPYHWAPFVLMGDWM